jgi:hypothetical protein
MSPQAFRENLESLEEAGFTVPPEEEWPPLMEELPYEAHEAFRLFSILPIMVAGMGGYIGKDITCLPALFDIYKVEEESRRTVTDIILVLINESVEDSNKKIAAQQKGKGNGS